MGLMQHRATAPHEGPSPVHAGLLDSNAAASWLGVAPYTLRRWRCEGRGPAFIKIGPLARYRLSDLEAFVASRRITPGGAA